MKRYRELDALRGIAALTVLIYHVLMLHSLFFVNTYGNNDYFLVNVIKYSPLRIFFAGEEAVVLFFVISGFVLSLSFLRGKKEKYSEYLFKKIFRIYIPFIVSIGIAALIAVNFPRGGIEGYETHSMLQSEINFKLLLQHIFMVGEYDSSALNPPIWFLIHYMRILIVFPLLMHFVLKFDWKRAIPFAMALSVLGVASDMMIPTVKSTISFSRSIHYMAFFVIGALLAKYKNELIDFFRNMKQPTRWLVLVSSLLAITFRWWFAHGESIIHHYMINQWVVVLGVSILIISSLSFTKISNFLLQNPFQFLGEISYSLFLVHMIVAFTTLRLFGTSLPYPIIAGIIIFMAIFVAYVYSITVEKCSAKLGKEIISKITK